VKTAAKVLAGVAWKVCRITGLASSVHILRSALNALI
jgi:hypothetical protein